MTDPAPESGNSETVIDQGLGLMPQDNSGQQPQDQGQQGQQQSEEEIRFNQAWNPMLQKLPKEFHNQVMPDLKQWDQNYNAGIQKVHSQYAGYKPFLDQQIAPEDINNALLVYNALNENPQALIQQMIDYYKYELPQSEQGQGDQQPEDEEIPYDVTQHPEFQRMAQLVELLGQNTLQQNEQLLQQQTDEQVEREFAEAKQKHGDFDEGWVAQMLYMQGQLGNRISVDEAVAAYQQHVQQIVQNHRPAGAGAPILMGGGGGLPSQQTNVGQLSDANRKKLVAETLARASQNGG